MVHVERRMYCFHESEPDSRPPPVSFCLFGTPVNSHYNKSGNNQPQKVSRLTHLATKGATDLGTAGADVDVDDAAVGAERASPLEDGGLVLGEERRGQTLRHRVVERDGFLQAAHLDDVHQRREQLMLRV